MFKKTAKIKGLHEYLNSFLLMDNQALEEEYNKQKQFVKNINESTIPFSFKKEFLDIIEQLGVAKYFNIDTFYLPDEKFKKAIMTAEYVGTFDLKWDIISEYGNYSIVQYGKTSLIVPSDMLSDIEETKDYDNVPIRELNGASSMLPVSMENLSVSDVREKESSQQDQINQLLEEMKSVKRCETEELAELQKEIRKRELELKEKQNAILKVLEEKKSEMEATLKKLQAQIYMMEAEIYSVRCFNGETLELLKLRTGQNAPDDAPFVLNQKIMYLDEDLVRLISLYNDDIIHNYSLFEQALKDNDEVMDAFCPQEKCITFFRVTKDNLEYIQAGDMVQATQLLHGGKMGFLVRNGENLYCGWMEDKWKEDSPITFKEEVFFRNGAVSTDKVSTDDKQTSTPVNERVSRMFAMSILQGLIDQKHILNFPEPVNVLKPSKYIVLNYADVWLDDNRYGDFATLVNNLHHYNKVGDTILLVQYLTDNSNNGDRGIGYNNRTHDCHVKSGINRINKIADGNYYVSAAKSWSDAGATANFQVYEEEFLNLTYFNSLWMKYYIQTKKVGEFGRMRVNGNIFDYYDSMTYSYLVSFFRKALSYLRDREKEEAKLIRAYCPDIDNVPEWQVLLSNWKILNKVRKITDFQAKRFAYYLEKGKFVYAAHLFEEWKPERVEDLDRKYNTTQLPGRRIVRMDPPCYSSHAGEHPLYGWKKYYTFGFNKNTENLENAVREDFQKILCIQKDVVGMLKTHHIDNAKKLIPAPAQDASELEKKLFQFCMRFSIEEPIPAYEELPADTATLFRSLMEMDVQIPENLYPLYYYRILQDNLLYKISWGINNVLEERYMYEVSENI